MTIDKIDFLVFCFTKREREGEKNNREVLRERLKRLHYKVVKDIWKMRKEKNPKVTKYFLAFDRICRIAWNDSVFFGKADLINF